MACWINGCTTKGGKKETFTKKSLFTARTEKMLQCWRDNGIGARGINELSKKSRICELHFEKDDILREDIFHMADGATITVQRKIPKLKEDAVPSIFPAPKISYCRLNPIYEEKPKEQQNGETSITAQLTWTEIKKNLTSLTLTSEYCMSMITEEMVMWVYWKEDLSSCTWRAILDKNMTLHIYVGEREINSLGAKIKSIEDIQNVLKKLSNINPCKEVGSKTCAKLCVGYVTRDCLVRGVQRQRCIPCAKKYKNILKKSKRPTPLQTLSKSGQSLRTRCKNTEGLRCKPTVCEDCLKTLVLGPNDPIPEKHRLILLKTKGNLKHPSAALVDLLSILEQEIIEATKTGDINADTLFSITNRIDALSPLPVVGCIKHDNEVTRKIIRFFLTTRMFFLCKRSNINNNVEKEQTKERRKCSKLSHASDSCYNNIQSPIAPICSEENAAHTTIKLKPARKRKYQKQGAIINKENVYKGNKKQKT